MTLNHNQLFYFTSLQVRPPSTLNLSFPTSQRRLPTRNTMPMCSRLLTLEVNKSTLRVYSPSTQSTSLLIYSPSTSLLIYLTIYKHTHLQAYSSTHHLQVYSSPTSLLTVYKSTQRLRVYKSPRPRSRSVFVQERARIIHIRLLCKETLPGILSLRLALMVVFFRHKW